MASLNNNNPILGSTGPAPNTAGPHQSDMLNKVDPLVDSDRDHRANPMSKVPGPGGVHSQSAFGANPAPNTAGPHKSDMLNRVDPRVDSDRDNSRTIGSNTTTGRDIPEGTHGPHSSKTANALDPRVDSDHDRTMGINSQHSHNSNTFGASRSSGAPEGTYGPHSSRLANAADPRVDSDRDNRAARPSEGVTGALHSSRPSEGVAGALHSSHLPGPAPNTAGPHKSDIMNKLDPRVDSNLDGSKTVGGNKTFEGNY